MAVVLPQGKQQFHTATGAPGVGYRLYAYVAGTSTPKDTYTTSVGNVANAHPVVADARGEMAVYWVGTYDVVLKDSADVTIWGPERLEDSSGNLEDALSASSGSSLVGFIQSGAGAVARTQQEKDRDSVSFEDYGAVGDGATDDTTAMNAALATGFNIRASDARKTYRITAPLVVNTDNQIVDFNFCEINLSDATGLLSNALLGDNTTQLTNVKLRHGRFTRAQAATAGAAIYARYIGDCFIENCLFYGDSKIYRGIDLSRGIRVRVANNFFLGVVNHGLLVQGTGTGIDSTIDVEVLNNRFDTLGGIGLNCYSYTEGIFCRGNIFYACTGGAVAVNAVSDASGLSSFKFESNDFDTSGGAGLYIQNVSNISINDNWFSNNTGSNLRIDSSVDSVVISGNQAYGGTAKNFEISADNVVITNNFLSGGDDGIFVRSTVNTCVIDGNVIRGMTGYGVNLAEAPVSVLPGSNIYLNNTTADVSTGPNVPTIASAATITLTGESDNFLISGTTNIGDILGGWAGRHVTLVFTGVLTVTNSTASATKVRLAGGANYTTAANYSLSLLYTGGQWYESSRAA